MKIGGLHGVLLQANVYESHYIFIQHVNCWRHVVKSEGHDRVLCTILIAQTNINGQWQS